MSQSLENMRRKLNGAAELGSVVRTMKALAAASIGQYEAAVRSLEGYYRAVDLGLAACLIKADHLDAAMARAASAEGPIGVLVFGSDQGLVGQFNDVVADFAVREMSLMMTTNKLLWAVGDYVHSRLLDSGYTPVSRFSLPASVSAITPLIGRILGEIEAHRAKGDVEQVYVIHNQPRSGAIYEPVIQRLLPLEGKSGQEVTDVSWQAHKIPEVIGDPVQALLALVREYLFVSLFRACAESLASENASRLAAMQRAENNIDGLREELTVSFNRLRQRKIDEELFDVISGFEAASGNTDPL